MKDFAPIERHEHPYGAQEIYKFPNGYGASVVPTGYSDGRQVAILAWNTGNTGTADDSHAWAATPTRFAPDGTIPTTLDRLEIILGVIEDLPNRTAPTRHRRKAHR